ncbi:MAG: Chitobiose ABC transporter, ATP-binding protein 1 [Ktedonobacterales bacterium]|jgi:peptide/nickel transport system ATP-binding protein|nr:MAG: Chitobiose ABC transporter, ATP-binding protein 1 [Ktedonobacterales bacterium]
MTLPPGSLPSDSANILEIKHLSVEYASASGTVRALNDVSIALQRGQILGLAGESGSGKTTLGHAIARLLHPPAAITGGQVFYYPAQESQHVRAEKTTGADQPVDVLRLTAKQLRVVRWSTLAIVFQSAMNALNPVLRLSSQIDDVIKAHRPVMTVQERRERANELLRLVGISPDRIKSYPHELSGGMRQRAIIAIALALSPEIIIMDEPTTALDVVVQREILMEIARLRERFNFSVIFITHDLSLLLELADKIAIMYAGRIIETATCDELKRQPRHPYSYGMLHSFPTLHGPRRRMTGIPGSPPDLREIPTGCAFHPRCPMAFAPCATALPAVRASSAETPKQLVACHLYDPAHTSGPLPTNADLGARYEEVYAQVGVKPKGTYKRAPVEEVR